MATDLKLEEIAEEQMPKKASEQILRHEIAEGKIVLDREAGRLFVSGLSAGLDLGFSLFLMGVMETRFTDHLSEPVRAILVANMYSIGFIFVVLGRSELFTEQTSLAVLPVLSGQRSGWSLARSWGIVYTSNLVGATAFAGLAVLIGPTLGVIDPRAFGTIAHHIVDHSGLAIFLSHPCRLADGALVVAGRCRPRHDQPDRGRLADHDRHRVRRFASRHSGNG